jgi:hypothetical protein
MTSNVKSGTAANRVANHARTSSGARSSASPTNLSTPPGSQHATIASGSRSATAAKYARATSAVPAPVAVCSEDATRGAYRARATGYAGGPTLLTENAAPCGSASTACLNRPSIGRS